MLIPKTLSKKKIMVYGMIMGFIWISIGYFVYNNFSKKPKAVPETISAPTAELVGFIPEGEIPQGLPLETREKPKLQTLQDLFQDPKFLALEQSKSLDFIEQTSGIPRDPILPLPPEEVRIDDPGLGDKLNIAWQISKESKSKNIRIYRSETQGNLGNLIAEISGDKNTYQDQKVSQGRIYYYTLHSVNLLGEESKNTDQHLGIAYNLIPPSPPRELIVEPGEKTGTLKISWQNPDDPDFAYVRIYRSLKKGELGDLVYDEVRGSSIEDKGLLNNVTYWYTLTSVDKSGNESTKKLRPPLGGNPNPFQ